VFFKLIKVHLLVSELYVYQNVRCNDKKNYVIMFSFIKVCTNCADWARSQNCEKRLLPSSCLSSVRME